MEVVRFAARAQPANVRGCVEPAVKGRKFRQERVTGDMERGYGTNKRFLPNPSLSSSNTYPSNYSGTATSSVFSGDTDSGT